jgi:hypothetical protein
MIPGHDDVYVVQLYVIKFYNDFQHIVGFQWILEINPTNKKKHTQKRNFVESGIFHLMVMLTVARKKYMILSSQSQSQRFY